MGPPFTRVVAAITLSCFGTTAGASTCYLFDANIHTTVTGPYSEVRNTASQEIIVRDEGGGNHTLELFIRYPGDMNAFDTQPGAIELMTNSMFARNAGMRAAQFDLGTIRSHGNGTFSFSLDPAAAHQLPPPNVFTVQGISGSPGGLGGICYLQSLQGLCEQTQGAAVLQVLYLVPAKGTVTFSFPEENSIQGTINITGYGVDNSNLRGNYRAQFNGPLKDEEEC